MSGRGRSGSTTFHWRSTSYTVRVDGDDTVRLCDPRESAGAFHAIGRLERGLVADRVRYSPIPDPAAFDRPDRAITTQLFMTRREAAAHLARRWLGEKFPLPH